MKKQQVNKPSVLDAALSELVAILSNTDKFNKQEVSDALENLNLKDYADNKEDHEMFDQLLKGIKNLDL